MIEMARPVQDDFNGELLNSEVDQTYKLSVTKYVEGENGRRDILKLEFDIGHASFMELIGSKFAGKKILDNWQKYVAPSAEDKAKGVKGKFIRVRS